MKINSWILSIFSLLIWSCEDFIEPNINKKEVTLNSPLDMDTLTGTVAFWWEEVESATHYNLQIVENSFASPVQLVLDSNIADNVFSIQLTEGLYEWKLSAQNNTSQTEYKSRSFYVIKSSDLVDETITLTSPQNNYNSNSLNQRFKWSTLLYADNYELEIIDNFEDVFAYEATINDTLTIALNEGIYTWRVKAKNTTSETGFSTSRTILIDNTAPTNPIQIDPINNSVDTSSTVTFSWNQGTSLSDITDTVYIYSDSLITIYETLYTTDTSFDYDFSSLGTYFWRVRSGDAAGNTSDYSDTRKFIIN